METLKKIRSRYVWPGLTVAALAGAFAVTGCSHAQDTSTAQDAALSAAKGAAGGSNQEKSIAMSEHQNHQTGIHESKTTAPTTRLEVESRPAQPVMGQPATWTMRVLDAKSGRPVAEFDHAHEKLMHLFVVSKDLSWFNHVHPVYRGNGIFTLEATLPRAGAYTMYADYKPSGRGQEVPQHEIRVRGERPLPSSASLTAAFPGKGGWLTTRVKSHPDGLPDAGGGPAYEVALMPMPGQIKAGEEVMLHFQVRDAQGRPVSELQPYMGAMGHAFILTSAGRKSLHAHPVEGGHMNEGTAHGTKPGDHANHQGHGSHGAAPNGGGADVIFHSTFPTAGLYKAWGQFKHEGQIITAAFVLEVDEGATGSSSGGHDVSTPHSH